jgi:hypothetical protein
MFAEWAANFPLATHNRAAPRSVQESNFLQPLRRHQSGSVFLTAFETIISSV